MLTTITSTMKTESFTEQLITLLKNAQTELEEFQVQLALGKAEASDKYEEIKGRFRQRLQDGRLKAIALKDKTRKIQNVFEELEVQLALGKAETREAFLDQKKRILKALSDLENILKNENIADDVYAELIHEGEKLKIKLEMLQLHFHLGKADLADLLAEKKAAFNRYLHELKTKLSEEKNTIVSASGHVKTELESAYSHLKKAFVHSSK